MDDDGKVERQEESSIYTLDNRHTSQNQILGNSITEL